MGKVQNIKFHEIIKKNKPTEPPRYVPPSAWIHSSIFFLMLNLLSPDIWIIGVFLVSAILKNKTKTT